MTGAHTPSVGHTAGPWEVSFVENDSGHVIRMGEAIETPWSFPSEQIIRYEHSLYPDDPDDATQFAIAEANARLIAASPDLLAACEAMMARWPKDQHEGSPLYDEAVAMRAAIARATSKEAQGND